MKHCTRAHSVVSFNTDLSHPVPSSRVQSEKNENVHARWLQDRFAADAGSPGRSNKRPRGNERRKRQHTSARMRINTIRVISRTQGLPRMLLHRRCGAT